MLFLLFFFVKAMLIIYFVNLTIITKRCVDYIIISKKHYEHYFVVSKFNNNKNNIY